MNTCKEGTHHFACECREAHFEKLADENAKLRNVCEAAWAECKTARDAEALCMDGESDPVTLRYADTIAAIPSTRATHDAARAAAGLDK